METAERDDQGHPTAGAHSSCERLYAHRVLRGWTQLVVAQKLHESLSSAGERRVSVQKLKSYVSRWENGEAWPDKLYQQHLVLVFDLNAHELGLLKPQELNRIPADLIQTNHGHEGARQVVTTTLVKEPTVFSAADSSAMVQRDRKITEVHASLTGRGTGPAPHVGVSLDPHDVQNASTNARDHQRWYWTLPAGQLVDRVLGQMEINVGLLTPAQADSRTFRMLAAALSHEALTAARLLFFDLGTPDLAARCLTIASHAADQALDHALAVAVYAHRAFVPGFAGIADQADWWLERAEAALPHAPGGPLLQSWFWCVAAEIYGLTQRPALALASIKKAEDALGTDGEDPTWLTWFSPSRFHGFAGQAYLVAGEHSRAASEVQLALDGLEQTGSKQRAVLLFDRALCEAPTDAEQAAATVWEGCDAYARAPYATASTRFPRLMTALGGTRFAGQLAERMRELPAPQQA